MLIAMPLETSIRWLMFALFRFSATTPKTVTSRGKEPRKEAVNRWRRVRRELN